MKKLILLMCVLATNVFAQPSNAPAGGANGQRGGQGQMREEMFSKFKQLRIEGIQARITIDQNTLSCVQSAQGHEEMKKCEETAKSAMENLKQTQMQKFQALKNSGGGMHQQGGGEQMQ